MDWNGLKWTGMGKFNSDDHYIFYCQQESLRRNGVAIIVNKSPKCSTWVQSQKRQNDLCFQGKPFNITVIQVYAPTSNAEEAEVERFYAPHLHDCIPSTHKHTVICPILKQMNKKAPTIFDSISLPILFSKVFYMHSLHCLSS